MAVLRGRCFFFIGKPADINYGWIKYVRAIQRRLLVAGSSTRNLSVLLSATHSGKELYNENSPSAIPVTVVRIIRAYIVCVPRVAAVAIRGRGLVKEIRYHHYGVCKPFFVAAASLPRTSLLER